MQKNILQARERANLSPAGLASVVTDGKWKLYDHLNLLNEFLLYLDARWIRRLMIFMPPQHGKSELTSRFFQAWYLGRHPDHKALLASYEAEFAAYWGRKSKDIIEEYGSQLFDIELNPKKQASNDWEIAGHDGGMRTAGSDGAFTGKKGDLVTIDDPHKNRKEARSKTFQQNIYDFYTDAADTRLSKIGIFPLIQTRWDILDLAGRIQKAEECITAAEALKIFSRNECVDPNTWVILKLPAIAKKEDILGRGVGEALCPGLHPLSELQAKKKRTPNNRWVSLYDQEPIQETGDFFEEEWFKIKGVAPKNIKRMIRWWDFASSKKQAQMKSAGIARTAGVLMGVTDDNDVWIFDSKYFQEKSGQVRKKVLATAARDRSRWGPRYGDNIVWIRGGKDPGQASSDQELTYSKLLLGYNFKLIREVGSKEDRADNVAEHAEINGLYLLDGTWNEEFIQEHLEFPDGEFKDQVDATSGAFSQLIQPEDEEMETLGIIA